MLVADSACPADGLASFFLFGVRFVALSWYDHLLLLVVFQLDRRTLLENLAMVLLAVDELVDAGKILEIDPSAIANRVLMRGADARQPQATELTVQQVCMQIVDDIIMGFGQEPDIVWILLERLKSVIFVQKLDFYLCETRCNVSKALVDSRLLQIVATCRAIAKR